MYLLYALNTNVPILYVAWALIARSTTSPTIRPLQSKLENSKKISLGAFFFLALIVLLTKRNTSGKFVKPKAKDTDRLNTCDETYMLDAFFD